MLLSNTQTIAKTLNTDCTTNIEFSGICTDTRKRMDGALFIALVGDNFDAHDYIDQAQKMGAVAVVVSKKVDSNLPVLMVKNTEIALSAIASWHLQNVKPAVIAITGSNGKTTTKNMLKNILQLKAPTLATKGNLNNHLGVPMTLLELEEKHQYAVIEMGANHLGEIAHLCTIAPPDVAVVTNTLDAHIGEFGGFDNLVKAKSEIYAPNTKNIVNTATGFSGDVSFGDGGDIFASNISHSSFDLNIFDKKVTIILQLLGRHNINNALAASACAYALGIDISLIKQGLENTAAEKGRLTVIQQGDLTLIDDTYNASPQSMKAAIATLQTFQGEKIAVFGDMGELGNNAKAFHQEIGQLAKNTLDKVYSYGELAKHYGSIHFDDLECLASHLLTHHPSATILIKGSRIAQLDKLIKILQK
ncbi:UDP-N-acetylmuramoyl-tripeptide--D-alanyl-D-alanine ligase (EC 6.3.2.10) [uncultured Gammaproteobacteria bacterium]|uniref:UDP-N-acetylmuramoyl-tripeptide--D-alanyl-D- alanine ligase n=1 Tax=Bathymodiolus heckerae thiotrophic gill symbiont TaxID=1052212 RepID=UPI0010B7CE0F|nr:UDP-N-acetylmuramoyl-tripeptide--D-alanyl-D-alanine ligase [Bathymodiolus heckerae thiotrophic gill symbiont]CAC9438387.1 UDP-N-acetylmuramoyl-tripeptide--D-alanyl-D-alanine ligase (EC 6.3.2.10) [uncultured Gammaproteobacteria bacterium]SMN12872.1 UDP-N-acetylmuramoylalanyl-D-glutamyl-2,6-diaminopimelate--D-alanyl-D-alanine ligase [Bathymodiolus heckerae thiotrophic gill symbiont]